MTDPMLLSEREKEVLQLVAEGLTNREISQRLSISANTVKVHLRNIFEKADVASRTEATVYAIEQRIVAVPGGEPTQSEGQTNRWTYLHKHPWIGIVGFFSVAALILTVILIITLPALESDIAPSNLERWQELTPMPEARIGLAAVAYDNQIYAIAGEGSQGVSSSVFRFDIETNSWESLLDKPTPVTDVGGVLIGEEIFIPGGLGEDGKPVNVLEIYDPRHNSWRAGASVPEPLSAYAIADFEGKLYLFGGWNGKEIVGDVWAYDPTADIWFDRGQLGFTLMDSTAVSMTDNIVLLGGVNEAGSIKEIVSFYPSRSESNEESWEYSGKLPVNSTHLSAVALNDLIYLFSENNTVQSNNDQGYSFVFYADSEWNNLNIELSFGPNRGPVLVALGPQLFFFLSAPDLTITDFVRYQALYYEIYVPIIN